MNQADLKKAISILFNSFYYWIMPWQRFWAHSNQYNLYKRTLTVIVYRIYVTEHWHLNDCRYKIYVHVNVYIMQSSFKNPNQKDCHGNRCKYPCVSRILTGFKSFNLCWFLHNMAENEKSVSHLVHDTYNCKRFFNPLF